MATTDDADQTEEHGDWPQVSNSDRLVLAATTVAIGEYSLISEQKIP